MEIRKIMCAVDLSEDSKPVARFAADMAETLGASVLVLYAAPSLSQYVGFHVPPNTIETFVDEIITGAEQNMKDFVEENFQGIQAEGKVVVGYASEEILRRATEDNCDLVIMGTHGRKGFDRILFGSVAEKVVQNSPVPVMTVRPEDLEDLED